MERKNKNLLTFTGPSGSGKSTLARHTSKYGHCNYFEGSAGLTLDEKTASFLQQTYGWQRSGHKEVIHLSETAPGFAYDFQIGLLKARIAKFLQVSEPTVTDRSLVDNIAYAALQAKKYLSDDKWQGFLDLAIKGLNETVEIIIFVPTQNPYTGGIEDNGSRIADWLFQKVASAHFEYAIELIRPHFNGRIHTIRNWDLRDRMDQVESIILGY